MQTKDCIFCKIVADQLPSSKIAENDDVLVIKDLYPKAPIHYLILPKKHIKDISQLDTDDTHLASKLLLMAQELSKKDEQHAQFRLVSNNGPLAGQCVFHIHLHFVAGKQLDF